MRKRGGGNPYLLTGPGDTRIEHNVPASVGDGAALSWAVGVILFVKGDNRPGTEVPAGDYLLTLIGPVQDEPLFKIRKHTYEAGRAIASWEAA